MAGGSDLVVPAILSGYRPNCASGPPAVETAAPAERMRRCLMAVGSLALRRLTGMSQDHETHSLSDGA